MAKYQIGNVRFTKELLAGKLGIDSKEISKIHPLEPFREGTSPYSNFYTLDVELKNGDIFPFFIKDVSDERKDATDELPTGAKLVGREIRTYELGNENGGAYPRFYGVETDSIKVRGKEGNIGHEYLYLERGSNSLEDVLSLLEIGAPDTEERAASHILQAAKEAILPNYKLLAGRGYSEDNKLQVYRLTRQTLESEIRQTWSYLLLYKFGKGSQTLTPSQNHSMIKWIEDNDYNRIIAVCFEQIVKRISPTKENEDEKGKDNRPLINLDLHPGQIMRKGDRWVEIDISKLGFGPLSIIPAALIYHPSVIGKLSKEKIKEIADEIFKQNEINFNGEIKDPDFAKKSRYDEQLSAMYRQILFRTMGFAAGMRIKYPKCFEALARENKIWEIDSCLNLLVNSFVNLKDNLTSYFEDVVDEPLKSLVKSNGSKTPAEGFPTPNSI